MSHRINREFSRPGTETVAEMETFSSALLSDVLDKDRRTMDAGLKPIGSPGTMAGPALTVDARPGDNLVVHRAVTLAQPGDVLIVDADGYTEGGLWGELMTLAGLETGLAGVVVDGAVRDVDDLENFDLPVFTRHVSPKGTTKVRPGSINVPITCGGVTVEPGDVVLGDRDGIVAIPREELDGALRAVRSKQKREEEIRNEEMVCTNYEEAFEEILAPLESKRYER